MENIHQIIKGNCFCDIRGCLIHFNSFSFKSIIRFNEIKSNNGLALKTWQAHKIESKLFYYSEGNFKINLVKPDSFEPLSEDLKGYTYELNSELQKYYLHQKDMPMD